jgi:hypothetical protein
MTNLILWQWISVCKLDYKTQDECILDASNQSLQKKEKRDKDSILNSFNVFSARIPTTLLLVRNIYWGIGSLGEASSLRKLEKVICWWGVCVVTTYGFYGGGV